MSRAFRFFGEHELDRLYYSLAEWQKLEDKKDNLPQPEPIEVEESVKNPVFDAWVANNDWYHNDKDMNAFSGVLGQRMQDKNPNMPYDKILQAVEAKIKETFPAKFENPNRNIPSAVDGGETRQVAAKSKAVVPKSSK